MKVCIFGARDLKLEKHYEAILEGMEWHFNFPDDEEIEIVEGGAPGIDSLAGRFARDNNLDLTVFYANWDKRGKSAGTHRNNRMADYCDAGLGIPGPDSRGTYHMINALKKRGKPVFVIDWFTHG